MEASQTLCHIHCGEIIASIQDVFSTLTDNSCNIILIATGSKEAPWGTFIMQYIHSCSKWWNIFNFQVVWTSKLCIRLLNGPMGLNLLEMVSYTYKLHYVLLVWLSLSHKYWQWGFGKCIIFIKNLQKRTWQWNEQTQNLNKSS